MGTVSKDKVSYVNLMDAGCGTRLVYNVVRMRFSTFRG